MTTTNSSAVTASRAVQSDNYRTMAASKLSVRQQQVMNAVLLAHARRQRDLSTTEICLVMEEQLGRRIASNDISGRIFELVTAGVLARAESRPCTVTGKNCNPVFAVAKQAELGLVKGRAAIQSAARPAGDGVHSTVPPSTESRTSGMPPEVRARMAAIKAAAQGK